MDIVFFLLLVVSFSCGVIIIFIIFSRKKYSSDPGTSSFLAPLIPLTLITLLEIVNYYIRTRFQSGGVMFSGLLDDWLLILVAFGWNYLTLKHYELNNISLFTAAKLRIIGMISLILILSAAGFYSFFPPGKSIIHFLTIIFLYFAGFRAIIFSVKVIAPLQSSKTAVWIAVISIIVYPVIITGNFYGWSFPFIDDKISFWVQAHPVYIIFVNIPVIIFLYNEKSIYEMIKSLPEAGNTVESLASDLSEREKEIFMLLYKGKRYKEIADSLFISLSTVKTHINHIYRKLDVSRREDLYRKLQNDSGM